MPLAMLAMPSAWPPRRRALAVLERLIDEAQHDARQRADTLEHLAEAGGDLSGARQRLNAARDRLVLLRQSRHCLLTGEPPDAPAAHP